MTSLLDALRRAAHDAGLTRLWVVPRDAVQAAAGSAAQGPTPARLHPGYRSALVLASAGPDFWRRARTALAAGAGPMARLRRDVLPPPAEDPLDRYTERVVEALAERLRREDDSALAVYPFRHERQVLGFRHLLGSAPFLAAPVPFGVTVAPDDGPWWALRGALLTALDLPPDAPRGESPCPACPAPCVGACPAGAVHRAGLDWPACVDFRLGGDTCAATCHARLACPVGAPLRYDAEAIAHHYTASLAELRALRHRPDET